MIELLIHQPVPVGLRPTGRARPIDPLMQQTETQDLLLGSLHVTRRQAAQPDQRADRLVGRVWNPYLTQLSGP